MNNFIIISNNKLKKLKLILCEPDIGGLGGLKPIYGIKGHGIQLKTRKESKVDVENFI